MVILDADGSDQVGEEVHDYEYHHGAKVEYSSFTELLCDEVTRLDNALNRDAERDLPIAYQEDRRNREEDVCPVQQPCAKRTVGVHEDAWFGLYHSTFSHPAGVRHVIKKELDDLNQDVDVQNHVLQLSQETGLLFSLAPLEGLVEHEEEESKIDDEQRQARPEDGPVDFPWHAVEVQS